MGVGQYKNWTIWIKTLESIRVRFWNHVTWNASLILVLFKIERCIWKELHLYNIFQTSFMYVCVNKYKQMWPHTNITMYIVYVQINNPLWFGVVLIQRKVKVIYMSMNTAKKLLVIWDFFNCRVQSGSWIKLVLIFIIVSFFFIIEIHRSKSP